MAMAPSQYAQPMAMAPSQFAQPAPASPFARPQPVQASPFGGQAGGNPFATRQTSRPSPFGAQAAPSFGLQPGAAQRPLDIFASPQLAQPQARPANGPPKAYTIDEFASTIAEEGRAPQNIDSSIKDVATGIKTILEQGRASINLPERFTGEQGMAALSVLLANYGYISTPGGILAPVLCMLVEEPNPSSPKATTEYIGRKPSVLKQFHGKTYSVYPVSASTKEANKALDVRPSDQRMVSLGNEMTRSMTGQSGGWGGPGPSQAPGMFTRAASAALGGASYY
jgi:hypothetical protein